MIIETLQFSRLLLLTGLICASTLPALSQEWIRSDKRDDIETFYQVEKIGTDKFSVTIRVQNNRSKPISVVVRVLYKDNRRLPSHSGGPSYGQCELTVEPGRSNTCEGVEVYAKKVTGVKIVQWDNADSKLKGRPPTIRRRI